MHILFVDKHNGADALRSMSVSLSPGPEYPDMEPHLDEPLLNATESAIISHIVNQNKAYFGSQQIDDPEITTEERFSICLNVWQKGVRQFLNRFSYHIQDAHLSYFENQTNYPSDDEYEIRFYLADARKRLKNRQRDVKNRRFAAMHRMITDEDCSYFDEHEMMARQPLLYDQLVGQYMTDTEKKVRDNFNPNAEFSGVLLEGISQQHIKDLQQKQQQEEEQTVDEEIEEEEDVWRPTNAHQDGIIDEEYFPQTPPSFKKHWGDFDDPAPAIPNPQAPSTSKISQIIAPTISTSKPAQRPIENTQKYVTSSEKELLRNEFFDTMQAQFLAGEDAEFDYTTVDDNPEYDDVEQMNRDEEERYFDAENDEDENDPDDVISREMKGSSMSDASDDELDDYMKGITKVS